MSSLINKIDVMPYFDFSMERAIRNIRMRNPRAEIIPVCAKTGEGFDAWIEWLLRNIKMWNA